MSFTVPTPTTVAEMTWEEIEPLYQALADRDLPDTDAIETWLADWSALDSSVMEAASVANVDASIDSTDPEKEARHLKFSGDIMPKRGKLADAIGRKLLDSGYSTPDLETVIRRMQTDRDLYQEANIPLKQELSKLSSDYNKICGAMTAEWDGKQIPLPRLNPFLEDADASVREDAWRKHLQPYIDERDRIADVFDRQLELRQELARNAGFANHRDYIFEEKYRYDYSPEDCYRFHDAVEQTFVPAVAKRQARRREIMGTETLRPWDLNQDPAGRPSLKPYDTVQEFTARAQSVFTRVSSDLGAEFGIMRDESLLDLESRAGKRPGGFCTSFPVRQRPFIFMNASGVGGDVRTLLHEAGHAFHGFATMEHLPYLWQRRYGSEMAEVASMSMELLSAPYLRETDGGFYTDEEAYARARIEHLNSILGLMPWVATIDAFQQWLYTDDAALDRDARDAKWLEIWQRFDPNTDWSGLEQYRIARWYKQLHLFNYPFYYIEYAIAQLGALQVWRNALADQERAVNDYRAALALGGSRPLPELFDRAGARLIFDAEGMQKLVDLIEAQLESLDGAETLA